MTPTTPDHRPGPIHLSSRLPWAETAVFVSVVPMLSLPVMLVAVLLAGAVAWLCLARHTALGHTSHGGQLTLHPHQGRPHRLRTSELSTADARAAVGSVVAEGEATVCRGTRALLATGPALALLR